MAHQQAGEWEQALSLFSQALQIQPDLAPVYRARAAAHLALGDPERALQDAQIAVALAPDVPEAHALLGEVLRRGFRAPLQALEAYDEAVRLDPALAPALFPARWECAEAAGLTDRMAQLALESARRYPSPMSAYYQGRALLAQGARRAAIERVGRAIQEEGSFAALWFVLGEAYAADGAWPQALTCYEEARRLTKAGDPSLSAVLTHPDRDLLLALGRAYLYVGRCGGGREPAARRRSRGQPSGPPHAHRPRNDLPGHRTTGPLIVRFLPLLPLLYQTIRPTLHIVPVNLKRHFRALHPDNEERTGSPRIPHPPRVSRVQLPDSIHLYRAVVVGVPTNIAPDAPVPEQLPEPVPVGRMGVQTIADVPDAAG